MHCVRRTIVLFVALWISCFLVGTQAYAQSNAATMDVRVIVGHADDARVDAALQKDQRTLREEFPQFTHFHQVHRASLTLVAHAPQDISLPGRQTASFTLEEKSSKQVRILVKVPGGEARLTGSPGGSMFVGGPKAPHGYIILWIKITN